MRRDLRLELQVQLPNKFVEQIMNKSGRRKRKEGFLLQPQLRMMESDSEVVLDLFKDFEI